MILNFRWYQHGEIEPSEACTALLDWWDPNPEGRKPTLTKGERAELRRCLSAAEAQTLSGFIKLKRAMGVFDARRVEKLAWVAIIAVHVRTHRCTNIASALPTQMSALVHGSPKVSPARMKKLLRSQTPMPDLRSTILQLGHIANIFDIAWSVYGWGDAVKARWATQYKGDL